MDFDLARLYEVETRVLNQAVRRNIDLFPSDFMFQLSPEDWNLMLSQFVMTYPIKQFSLNYKELAERIKILEEKYHKDFKEIYKVINYLLENDAKNKEQQNRKRIGY